MSRIGKVPVEIPTGVKVSVNGLSVAVEGPKGKLSQDFLPLVSVKVDGNMVVVERKDDSKPARAAHGLYRALIHNMVEGVSKGFSKSLVINGVGYRAEVKGKELVMNLGYSTDFIVMVPEGLSVVADDQNKITISGIDKQRVGQFAAEVRKLRPPEPYKQKGIRYENEVIRKKVGKSGVK